MFSTIFHSARTYESREKDIMKRIFLLKWSNAGTQWKAKKSPKSDWLWSWWLKHVPSVEKMLKNGLCSLTGPGFLCHWSSLTDNICPKAILLCFIILEQSLRIEPGNRLVLNDFFSFCTVEGRLTTKSSFTGLYLPYKPNALPFECPGQSLVLVLDL